MSNSEQEQPVFGEVGIVALVPDRFAGAWQPRHQVMTRLARYFPVVWVEPARSWREKLPNSPSRTGASASMGAPAPSGLMVVDPSRRYPKFHRPAWLGELTARARMRSAVRELRSAGCRRVVLYLWRPGFSSDLDRVEHDVSCYHIDDEYSFSPSDVPLSALEASLLDRVDQVFIHSPALMEKKGALNPNTSFVPNGVAYEQFATPVPEPADLAAVPHPRVGYVGFLKKQLDWELLDQLSRRHPKWSFVFVGPRHEHPEIQRVLAAMETRKNVHFLGGKPVTELGAYPQHFDVSILPYVVDDYTRYINPLKLYEYLAAGPPVVGSPIRTLQDFEEVVDLASGAEEWSGALARALGREANSPERVEARREIARRYDWDRLVHGIARDLVGHLGGAVEGRLDAAVPEPAGLDRRPRAAVDG
ncbi:MAG: glycosyltransferase [Gemmatimonadota bacterium]